MWPTGSEQSLSSSLPPVPGYPGAQTQCMLWPKPGKRLTPVLTNPHHTLHVQQTCALLCHVINLTRSSTIVASGQTGLRWTTRGLRLRGKGADPFRQRSQANKVFFTRSFTAVKRRSGTVVKTSGTSYRLCRGRYSG